MYQFLRFPGFRLKALTLSYDDGTIFDSRLVSIMKKNGIKGTFNLNSNINFRPNPRKLTLEDAWAQYSDAGCELAVHGVEHYSLAEIPSPMMAREVLEDRVAMEKVTGAIVRGMAYANGSFNDEVVDVLRLSGIAYCRTTHSTERFDLPTDWLRLDPTCHHENPRLFELLDKFLDYKVDPKQYYWRFKPALFYLWGHSYEFDNNNNWERIEQFLEKAGGHEDIWYATNIEIYEYLEAYRSLVFSADGTLVYNPTNVEVYLNYLGNSCVVAPGQTLKVK